jgi:hypothetical protein
MSWLQELEALVKLGLAGNDAAWERALAAFRARYAPQSVRSGGLLAEEAGGPRERQVLAGEGMLLAVASGTYVDEFGERQTFTAGRTRVVPSHPLARARPDAFRLAMANDVATAKLHRGNLRARMDELRAEQRSLAKPTARPAWWIG